MIASDNRDPLTKALMTVVQPKAGVAQQAARGGLARTGRAQGGRCELIATPRSGL